MAELLDRAATATPTRKVGAGILTFLILRLLAHFDVTPETLGLSPESEQALIAFTVMWLTREPSPVTVVDARPVAPGHPEPVAPRAAVPVAPASSSVFDQEAEPAAVAPAAGVQSPAPPPPSPADGRTEAQPPAPPPPGG